MHYHSSGSLYKREQALAMPITLIRKQEERHGTIEQRQQEAEFGRRTSNQIHNRDRHRHQCCAQTTDDDIKYHQV